MSLKSIEKLKGRTFKELRFRGEQFLSVKAEQIGLSGNLPDAAQFWKSIKKPLRQERSGSRLLENFRASAERNFFAPFADQSAAVELFEKTFPKQRQASIINRAERLFVGKYQILGYGDLYFGSPVDWLFHPISGKKFPLEHWKAFQNLPVGDDNDWRITFELNRHQHFFHLGAAYWLTGNEKFAECFIRNITGWIKQNPPHTGINWSSSLEVGLRAVSWTWALAFFRDSESLNEAAFGKIIRGIYAHARHLSKYLSVYFSPDNHLTGEAFALYTIGSIFEDFERADEWRERGKQILLREMERQILSDGAYFGRSTFYHRYTTEFYLQFFLLAQRRGENISFAERINLEAKIKQMLDYLLNFSQPDGTTPFIGDDDGGVVLPFGKAANNDFRSLFAVGAALFEREDYKFAAGKFGERAFWLLGAEGLKTFQSLKAAPPENNDKAFADGGLFVTRSSWQKDGEVLIINSGETQTDALPHAHADALSFLYTFGGKPFLVENGTYSYYENHNVRDYFRSSEAHNTLTIDEKSSSAPADIFNWQTLAKPRTESFLTNPRFVFYQGENRIDAPEPITHRRSFLHLKENYWLMHDRVEAAGAHRCDLNFHFAPDVEVLRVETGGDLSRLVLRNGSAEIHLATFAVGGKHLRTGGWHSPHYGFKTLSEMYRVTTSNSNSPDFYSFFLPKRAGLSAPEIFSEKASHGHAFVLRSVEFEDFFINSKDSSKLNNTTHFETDFRYVWARFDRKNSELREMILIGGQNLIYKGRALLNSPREIASAVVCRVGETLEFETDTNSFRLPFPPER